MARQTWKPASAPPTYKARQAAFRLLFLEKILKNLKKLLTNEEQPAII
jgi:hypothetical protein